MIKEINNETMVFSGVIKAVYKRKDTDNKGRVKEDSPIKNVITVFPDDKKKVFDAIYAYEDSGDKYTPDWFKNKEFIRLKSAYNIPVQIDGEEVSFNDWLDRGLVKGAKVNVKMTQQDGVIYPDAIVVKEDGEKFDPFEGM